MTLAISSAHSDLLLAIGRSQGAPRVVVIGAAALGHHVPLTRTTADVDFVVVADAIEISALLDSLAWRRDPKQKQRWRDRHGNMVDVLPATADVIAAGTVTLENDERVLSTVGFDLVLDHASPVAILGSDAQVDVASLAAIIVLKILAWLDRPHERRKDLADLGRVFETVLDDWDARRWEPPLADLEHEVQGAFFVGSQVARILRVTHRAKMAEFFVRIASEAWASIIGAGGLACTDPEEVAERRLVAFRRGLGQV